MTKATRAMYPESSRMERNKKSTTIIGRKVSTLPTPVSTPSTASERTTSLVPNALRPASAEAMMVAIPSSMSPCNAAPITPNVSRKTRPMITRNAGMAV